MPRVTVVLPCYNHAQFIGKTLDCILAQSYNDFEIVAVDDGSTDGSLEVLQRFEPRVRVLRGQHNGPAGPAAARNRAIEASDSDFIAFMDADDLCTPDRLAVQVNRLDADRLDLVASELTFIDPQGNALEGKWSCPPYASADYWGSLLERNWIGTPSVTLRRSALDSAGSFNEEFTHAEDYDLWLRLARSSAVGYVNAPLIQVRRHGGNISRNIAAHQHFERRALQRVNPLEAWAAFSRLHSRRDRAAEAWIWFLLRRGSEDNENFEAECRRAIAEHPGSSSLRFALGVFLCDTGAYDVSWELFRGIKDDAASLNNFAVLAALREDDEAARSALEAAIAMRPGYQDAQSNLSALSKNKPLALTRRPLRMHLVPDVTCSY